MEDNKVVTQANENEIVLDALESYVVKDKSGKVLGEFHFDPSDADMPKRIQKVIEWFETVTVPEEEDSTEAFYKLSDELKQKINEALNSDDAADALFYSNPFSPTADGSFLAEKVLNAIASVIQSKTGERMKKVNRRLKQYTKKYHS